MPVPIGREWEEWVVSKEAKIISKEKKTKQPTTSLSSVEW